MEVLNSICRKNVIPSKIFYALFFGTDYNIIISCQVSAAKLSFVCQKFIQQFNSIYSTTAPAAAAGVAISTDTNEN